MDRLPTVLRPLEGVSVVEHAERALKGYLTTRFERIHIDHIRMLVKDRMLGWSPSPFHPEEELRILEQIYEGLEIVANDWDRVFDVYPPHQHEGVAVCILRASAFVLSQMHELWGNSIKPRDSVPSAPARIQHATPPRRRPVQFQPVTRRPPSA